jgi:hypothetical protein
VNAREELNFGGPNFDIEDYSFLNFAAEYEVNRHVSIFGRIDNLSDEQYSEVFGFPALGRAAYGGLKLRFEQRSLEADLQNTTIGPDQPPGFGSGKSYRPETTYTGQGEPGVSLIRSPGRASVIGRDHYCAPEIVSRAATSATHIAQAENRSPDRRRRCKSPRLTAITRSCGARAIRIPRIQITAPYDAMKRITESDSEGTRAGRAKQRRVMRIPRVALVSGGQDPGNRRAACRYPCVPPTLSCDASATRREREFTRQCRRQIVTDILPGRSVGRAEVREHSIH